MAFSSGRSTGQIADINMTPLIDVLLVLIVIFMVITPLTPTGLEAQVPRDSAHRDQAPALASIVLTVLPNDMVHLNREPVPVTALEDRLVDVFRTSGRPTVFVQGSGALEFRHVARVIDIASGAGFRRIGLMTGTTLR